MILGGKTHHVIAILEDMITVAAAEDKQTTVLALQDEIEKLKLQQENPTHVSFQETPMLEEAAETPHEDSKSPDDSHDDEIMSIYSTPTVSTVQMSHLSDVLSVQINDVEVLPFH